MSQAINVETLEVQTSILQYSKPMFTITKNWTGPFRLLDLPVEVQMMIFMFYFESPFDINIGHAWNPDTEERSEKQIDSRSSFFALWTSPDIYQQAHRAYFKGFSGRVHLESFGAYDDENCLAMAYNKMFRTIPIEKVKILDLGAHVSECLCLEYVHLCKSNEEKEDWGCQRDFGITGRFPNLERVKMEITYCGDSDDEEAQPLTIHTEKIHEIDDGLFDDDALQEVKDHLQMPCPQLGHPIRQAVSGKVVPVEFYYANQVVVIGSDTREDKNKECEQHNKDYEKKEFWYETGVLVFKLTSKSIEDVKIVKRKLYRRPWSRLYLSDVAQLAS